MLTRRDVLKASLLASTGIAFAVPLSTAQSVEPLPRRIDVLDYRFFWDICEYRVLAGGKEVSFVRRVDLDRGMVEVMLLNSAMNRSPTQYAALHYAPNDKNCYLNVARVHRPDLAIVKTPRPHPWPPPDIAENRLGNPHVLENTILVGVELDAERAELRHIYRYSSAPAVSREPRFFHTL